MLPISQNQEWIQFLNKVGIRYIVWKDLGATLQFTSGIKKNPSFYK